MRILITFQYFLPAYKAGGPIQSIKNLVNYLSSVGDEVFVFCSNKDLDGTVLDVIPDKWVSFNSAAKVYYCSNKIDKDDVAQLIGDIKPDVLFINGLYSLPYTIYPLKYKGNCTKILSVRGMLHPGALSQKKLKKSIYLNIFLFLNLHKKCVFHATTVEEVEYIHKIMGRKAKVLMVPNLPNVLPYHDAIVKAPGKLKLVSVSLISPMKNILLIVQAVKNCNSAIEYDIYGPIKDKAYWDECIECIKRVPPNISINIKGEIEPEKVVDVLGNYHYFILPSKSENFGHAIYEALSVGRPVITSHNTPWNGLEKNNAGYNVDPDNIQELTNAIEEAAKLTSDNFIQKTIAAKQYVEKKYNVDNIQKQYKNMFS